METVGVKAVKASNSKG